MDDNTCGLCNGYGRHEYGKCHSCNGTGLQDVRFNDPNTKFELVPLPYEKKIWMNKFRAWLNSFKMREVRILKVKDKRYWFVQYKNTYFGFLSLGWITVDPFRDDIDIPIPFNSYTTAV